ncbi:MAG: hypothetical protein ACI85O_001025 [Saprospiraceae bacterium]|jgi:hypothetical protein
MNITNNERIEQYLLNRMTENEKSAFQFELMQDRNLQEEVKNMRRVQKTFIAASRGNSDFSQPLFDKKWLLLLLLLPLLYFVLNFSTGNNNTPPPTNEKETVTPIIKEETKVEEGTIENPETIETETDKSIEKENTIPKLEIEEQPQKVEEKTETPVYAANYDANPLIENELNSFLRGDYKVTKISPIGERTYIAKDGRISFSYRGELETEKMPEDDFSLIMEIYSNELDAFKLERFIIQSPVDLSSEASPYQLAWAANFDVEPKLYYYLLRDDYSGVTLNGGKFKVK